MDDFDLDEFDPYEEPRRRGVPYWLLLPIAALLIAVALVSGLVFGGVIQGDASRVGPTEEPTTESTILITP